MFLREVVAAHLSRPLCPQAIRQVEICVLSGGAPRVTFHVGHAWRLSGDLCSSLYTVLPGCPLSGTTVLMRERAFAPVPEIWVRPATAVRVVPAAGNRAEEHVLATDLTYDDLRFWTPRVVTAAVTWVTDGGSVTLRSAWRYRGRVPVTAEGRLDEDGVVIAVDVTSNDRPLRSLRAENVVTVCGMRTPLVMTAARPVEGFETRMRLIRMQAGIDLPAKLLEPSGLAEAGRVVAAAARSAASVGVERLIASEGPAEQVSWCSR